MSFHLVMDDMCVFHKHSGIYENVYAHTKRMDFTLAVTHFRRFL